MKKSQRFIPLAMLAKNREQAAAVALGVSNKNLFDNQSQLEALKTYRAEYTRRFTEDGKEGMEASSLHTYKAFIDGLDKAIQQQMYKITEAQNSCRTLRHAWQQTHKKTRIMETTIERFQHQEQQHSTRREQHELDDAVTCRHKHTEKQ